jgi:hypothetical protein
MSGFLLYCTSPLDRENVSNVASIRYPELHNVMTVFKFAWPAFHGRNSLSSCLFGLQRNYHLLVQDDFKLMAETKLEIFYGSSISYSSLSFEKEAKPPASLSINVHIHFYFKVIKRWQYETKHANASRLH